MAALKAAIDPGVRLFDLGERLVARQYVAPEAGTSNRTDIEQGQAKLVPIYNIFASSIMAARSPIVAAQLPIATWRIGAEDASTWGISAGDYLAIDIEQQQMTLPVQVVDYLAEGCIGYPVGQVSIIHPSVPASVSKVKAPVADVKINGDMADDIASGVASDMAATADDVSSSSTQEV